MKPGLRFFGGKNPIPSSCFDPSAITPELLQTLCDKGFEVELVDPWHYTEECGYSRINDFDEALKSFNHPNFRMVKADYAVIKRLKEFFYSYKRNKD